LYCPCPVPKTKFGSIDDVGRRGSAGRGSDQDAEWDDGWRILAEGEMCSSLVLQLDNITHIGLKKEKFSISGIRGLVGAFLSNLVERARSRHSTPAG
jgi:hypothetical protein